MIVSISHGACSRITKSSVKSVREVTSNTFCPRLVLAILSGLSDIVVRDQGVANTQKSSKESMSSIIRNA